MNNGKNAFFSLFSILFTLTIFFTFHQDAYANNPPSANNSSIAVSGTAPADGSSTITVTVSLADSNGTPVGGDTVTFSDSDSSNTLSPTSAILNSSGQASFTASSINAETNTISITDTTSGTTLSNLGQITFTASSSSTPTPTPTGSCGNQTPATPSLVRATAQGLTAITLTWTDASDPVSNYSLSYGTTSGKYAYGATNIGGQGTTSYTVGSLAQNTTYYFVIAAVNGCSTGNVSNEVSSTTGGSNTSSTTSGDILGTSDTTSLDTPTDTPIPSPSSDTLVTSLPTLAPTQVAGWSGSKITFTTIAILIIVGAGGYFYWRLRKPSRKRGQINNISQFTKKEIGQEKSKESQ